MAVRVGDMVGARRWPRSTCHTSSWGRPHQGQVLDVRDPRAWSGTLAFGGTPTQGEVDLYVDRMECDGGIVRTPVLWRFGHFCMVSWEVPERLVPYAQDFLAWVAAKAKQEEQACVAA